MADTNQPAMNIS